MVEKSNYLNNTLNIFTLLNIKENLANQKLKNHKKINIKKIWNCVQNPEINSSEIKEILTNKYLTNIFYEIMRETSSFYFPKAKAAATNSLTRKCKEFEITSFSSKKNPDMLYIKLKFLVTIDKKLKYLYVGKNNHFVSKELPGMINNEFQFMLNSDDNFFTLLQDPDTEIFIR